jgi:NAD(P)-dependent dehydrogenase (short-subunit alcohol dehydrogenase family)
VRAAHGRIVLISSDSGLVGTAGFAGYTASKFALEGWGESLADELRPFGVRVSIIEPGPFRTGIAAAADLNRGSDNGPYARLTAMAERGLDELANRSPEPAPVVDAAIRALTSARPRLRYPVGREARTISAARGILPEPAFRWLARRLTGTAGWWR